jgi:hypothetical protein
LSSHLIDFLGRLGATPYAWRPPRRGTRCDPVRAAIERGGQSEIPRISTEPALIGSRPGLDDLECFVQILGLDQVHPSRDRGRSFDHHLRHIIKRYGLATLFSDDGPGPRHHAIRPAGYDFHSDAVIPIAMEKWRADYRAMAAHRQMLAASIIWLYRGGKDSCWLRRVPCTWRAADGLHALRSGGYRRLGPAVSPLPRLVATPRSSPLTEAAAPCTMTAQL